MNAFATKAEGPYAAFDLLASIAPEVCSITYTYNGTVSCKDTAMGIRAAAGLRVNDYLAIEGGYFNSGNFTVDISSASSTTSFKGQERSAQIMAMFMYPSSDVTSFFFKVGRGRYSIKETVTVSTGSFGGVSTVTGSSPIIGLGFETREIDRSGWGIRLQYEEHEIKDDKLQFKSRVRTFSVGAILPFK